jgi:hypothetical protein
MVSGDGSQPRSASVKSYVGQAVLTFFLYYLGFWIVGLIVNILFLNEARDYQRTVGRSPSGVGCLWALIIVHVAVPAVLAMIALLVLVVALAIGAVSMSDLPM